MVLEPVMRRSSFKVTGLFCNTYMTISVQLCQSVRKYLGNAKEGGTWQCCKHTCHLHPPQETDSKDEPGGLSASSFARGKLAVT